MPSANHFKHKKELEINFVIVSVHVESVETPSVDRAL